MHRRSPEGWLLVGLIVLVTAVILALAGVTFFLTQQLTVTSLRQNQTRAIYLAQAGIMDAFYDFRNDTGITLGQQLFEGGPDLYNLQTSNLADYLLISMRGNITMPFPQTSFCGATRDRIQNWNVRNTLASNGPAMTVAKVKVHWSPFNNEGIVRIDLHGNKIWPVSGCPVANMDDEIPITNQSLSPGSGVGSRWASNAIWFTSATMDTLGSNATSLSVDITLILTDGSSQTGHWHIQNVAERTADIVLKSLGEVHQGAFPFVVWRRIQTKYRVCAQTSGTTCNSNSEEETQPAAILSYQELTTLTP